MKKFLFILLFVPTLTLAQTPFSFEGWDADKVLTWNVNGKAGNNADSALTEGKKPTFLGKLSMNDVCFCLRVATRGTNDSLIVTVQTTEEPSDTNTWQTLTTFDGVKTTVSNTVRCFPVGTPARDSVLPLFKYVRVIQDHSIAAPAATDTSSWYLFIRQKGLRRY